jgi:hypothetical protein
MTNSLSRWTIFFLIFSSSSQLKIIIIQFLLFQNYYAINMLTRLIVLALWIFSYLKFIMMNFLYCQATLLMQKIIFNVYFFLFSMIIFACYILHSGWNSFMYEFENDDYSLILLIFSQVFSCLNSYTRNANSHC